MKFFQIQFASFSDNDKRYFSKNSIDEYVEICYPNDLPLITLLSNCTLSFVGPVAGICYGIALQIHKQVSK